jgi:lysyl-tRNA synthetase class 2
MLAGLGAQLLASCEFYMAYADYNDLMVMSEQLLSGMVKDIRGSYLLEYHTKGRDHPDSKITIDFTPPFRRIQMIPELERLLKVRLVLNRWLWPCC